MRTAKVLATIGIAALTYTTVQAQHNDQRLNRAITDKEQFKNAVSTAPTLRDLLRQRKNAVNQFLAIPTEYIQPIVLKAFATAEQRAGTRHVLIREFGYLNDSAFNNGGFDLGIGTPDHMHAAIAGDLADSFITQAALLNIPIDSLSINFQDNLKDITNWDFHYTVYIDSPAGDEELAKLKEAAEANSPLFQFTLGERDVEVELELKKSPKNIVIPPTYQPGLRDFLKWETKKIKDSKRTGIRTGGDYPYSRVNEFTSYPKDSYIENADASSDGTLPYTTSPTGVVSHGITAMVNPAGPIMLQVRHHRILQDRPAFLGGSDLGPTALESQLGLLGSCFVHVLEGNAARHEIAVDTIRVQITGDWDLRAGRPGFEEVKPYPTNIKMRVQIASPETLDRVKYLISETERNCPIYNLLKHKQTIVGRIKRVKKSL